MSQRVVRLKRALPAAPPPNTPRVKFKPAGSSEAPAGTIVGVLAYSTQANSQLVEFDLSLANTNMLAQGYSGPETYDWQPTTPDEGKLQIIGNSHAATARGRATIAGVFEAVCVVKYTKISTGEPTFFTFIGDCAVIGGSLQFSVQQGTLPTYDNDFDGDASTPWYVQYFGYSHWNPPADLTTMTQKTQDVSVVTPIQPPETDCYWNVPAPLDYFYEGGGFPSWGSETIRVFAEEARVAQEVWCGFALEFTGMHGDTAFNIGFDDTTSVPIPSTSKFRTNRVSGHKPSETNSISSPPGGVFMPPNIPPGGGGTGYADYIEVKCQLGIRMPGLWVQERISNLPPGGDQNHWMRPFITATKTDPYFGTFIDYLWYKWAPPPPFTNHQLSQAYWAATKHTTSPGSGVNIGAWTIEITISPPNTSISHHK